jgi:hypothetical protein
MFRSLVLFLALSSQAFAWGPLGHKIVAQVAEENLTEKAKLEVKNLIQNQTMADVATWADTIRNQPEWQFTKTWHFVSIPDGDTYEEIQKDPNGDVIESINSAISTLKMKTGSKDDQLNALRFLIHFVGDVHQPLHVGRAEDRGGNEVQVTFMGRSCNLHALWDTILIDSQKIGVKEYSIKLQSIKRENQNFDFNYDQIVKENMELRTKVYDFKSADLGAEYLSQNIEAANTRLFLGGKRLASILNNLYK